jgi:hypothetical protein
MALHFDLSDVANRHENYPMTEDGRMNPATESLIFVTMAVGMGTITEDNWKRFAVRLDILQSLFGRHGHVPDGNGGIRPIDHREVKGHIGLKTNVSPETDAAWRKRTFERAMQEKVYALTRSETITGEPEIRNN